MTILVVIFTGALILYELEGYFRRLGSRLDGRLDAIERHLFNGKTLAEKERIK